MSAPDSTITNPLLMSLISACISNSYHTKNGNAENDVNGIVSLPAIAIFTTDRHVKK